MKHVRWYRSETVLKHTFSATKVIDPPLVLSRSASPIFSGLTLLTTLASAISAGKKASASAATISDLQALMVPCWRIQVARGINAA